jgi:hypothetical protein
MYVMTVVLFLVPLSILGIAWRGEFRTSKEITHLDWRSYCTKLALAVATIFTLTALASWLSWTYNGGSPHGMMPRAGLWVTLGPINKRLLVATLAIAIFARGKGRLSAVGSAISDVFIIFLLSNLERD